MPSSPVRTRKTRNLLGNRPSTRVYFVFLRGVLNHSFNDVLLLVCADFFCSACLKAELLIDAHSLTLLALLG